MSILKISSGKDCVFCESASRIFGNTPDFMRLLNGSVANRIIFESQNFVVLPSLGQIVEGYLLIMPKEHFPSIALMSDDLLREMEQVHEVTKRILGQAYAQPISFEHGGSSPASQVRCCVEHAHLHVVPLQLRLSTHLTKEFRGKRVRNFSDIRFKIESEDYLFVEDYDSKRYAYETPNLSSQFVRYLIARIIGFPEKGDWMVYPGVEEIKRTIHRLSFWKPQTIAPVP